MKFYESFLQAGGIKTKYIECDDLENTVDIAGVLQSNKVTAVRYCEPSDDWVGTSLAAALDEVGIEKVILDTPLFINSSDEIEKYFMGRRSFSMAKFYQRERERHSILMTDDGKPVGGKFSFDTENRKRLPKNISVPRLLRPDQNKFVEEALRYVEKNFSDHYGDANDFAYPITFDDAEKWFDQFLKERFYLFGDYEDAISCGEDYVFHSVLTPMLNIGLLTPQYVVEKTLKFADKNKIPINSVEGFIRQIIGWREYMRGVYDAIGRRLRTANYWKHRRKLPASFWNATTGIDPLDATIRKVLRNAYTHHIERLMIVGNFMVLTEIDPDEAYRWFMELYIDAYDWVMVPNVYGMSLQSDGGSITTKPYISGSNYIRKMSDYPAGEWCDIWDGLYWRFIAKHEKFFTKNPRLSMMPRMLAKMDAAKRERLINTAENYLANFS